MTDTLDAVPWDALGALSRVRSALITELERRGLAELQSRIPQQLSSHELRTDPFDHSQTLAGTWLGSGGQRLGSVQIHEGGRVFAEFDLLVPHPTDPRWFVEAVTAWGQPPALKSELRLLPALGA
ncbi:MAG: hypothetical protein SV765_13855 [Pseudomonadota bacterium]|nr:hypothetical protein [Pseudomonadales bacterium]MDY6921284.1 hypothetical protein [Pseudomonadota bacterium]